VTECTLYGLRGPNIGLLTVNTRTGFQRPVGIPLKSEFAGPQLSSIDAANNILYLVGYNATISAVNLVGISLETGLPLLSIPLPFTATGFGFGQTCDFNVNTGQVLVSGRDPNKGNYHHIVSVDPKSKVITSVAVVGDFDLPGGASTYDAKNNVIWIQFLTAGTIMNVRVDVATGTIANVANTFSLETMDFDPKTGLIYGVGLQVDSPTSFYRVILTLDSTTNKFTVVASIPGYYDIRPAESAIDLDGRKYYTLLKPIGHSALPFQLVEFDLNTNMVTNHPTVGNLHCDTCPLSLNWAPSSSSV